MAKKKPILGLNFKFLKTNEKPIGSSQKLLLMQNKGAHTIPNTEECENKDFFRKLFEAIELHRSRRIVPGEK